MLTFGFHATMALAHPYSIGVLSILQALKQYGEACYCKRFVRVTKDSFNANNFFAAGVKVKTI